MDSTKELITRNEKASRPLLPNFPIFAAYDFNFDINQD